MLTSLKMYLFAFFKTLIRKMKILVESEGKTLKMMEEGGNKNRLMGRKRCIQAHRMRKTETESQVWK